MITRLFYIASQILDTLFVFLFLWTIKSCVGFEIIKVGNEKIIYTNKLALILYTVFIIIYFIIYPLLNNKMSLFENIFSLSLVDKSISFMKILFTNMVFWLALLELIINLVEFPSINFHSNFIILFIAFMYLIFLFLEIDLISLFGNNIKFKRE